MMHVLHVYLLSPHLLGELGRRVPFALGIFIHVSHTALWLWLPVVSENMCRVHLNRADFAALLRRPQVATAAEEYGYHMGLAFQIVDDILDIVGAADVSHSLVVCCG